jgi:hypothetical protein
VLTGNDATAQPGYSADTSVIPPVPGGTQAAALVAAYNKPFKTLERVGQLLPRHGNNANLLVLVKPRVGGATYRNMANTDDQDMSWLSQVTGWNSVMVRGTDNFVDTGADQITAGYMVLPSTFSGGYNTIAGSTANSLNCQRVGGSAAGFPAEAAGVSAITGYRIRFDAATATALLQNYCTMVYKNTTSVIVPADTLPAVPTASDVFYIEQPGVAVGDFSHSVVQGGFAAGEASALVISGFRSAAFNATVLSGSGEEQHLGVFLDRTAPVFTALYTYTARSTLPSVAPGDAPSIGTSLFCGSFLHNDSFTEALNIAAVSTTVSFLSSLEATIGASSVWRGGIGINVNGAGQVLAGVSNIMVGYYSGTRPPRITHPGGGGAIEIYAGTGVSIMSADVSNSTVPVVKITTINGSISLDAITSSDGGNTNTVIDVTGAVETTVTVGKYSAVTATAAQGDIRLSGSAIGSIANLAITNYPDPSGNNIIGNAGVVSSNGISMIMDSVSTIAAFSTVRGSTSQNHVAPAQATDSFLGLAPLGVTLTDAANGSPVLVVVQGPVVAKFNAANPLQGARAFLSDTLGLLKSLTPPTDGVVPVGVVAREVSVGSFLAVISFNPTLITPVLGTLQLGGITTVSEEGLIERWVYQGVAEAGLTVFEFPITDALALGAGHLHVAWTCFSYTGPAGANFSLTCQGRDFGPLFAPAHAEASGAFTVAIPNPAISPLPQGVGLSVVPGGEGVTVIAIAVTVTLEP